MKKTSHFRSLMILSVLLLLLPLSQPKAFAARAKESWASLAHYQHSLLQDHDSQYRYHKQQARNPALPPQLQNAHEDAAPTQTLAKRASIITPLRPIK